MQKEPHTKVKTHKLHSFFVGIITIFGVYLIISSIGFIWLDQTLTNTNTYVATVAPLVTKPAVQKYIAQEVTTAILNNSPNQDLANSLLPPGTDTSTLNTQQIGNLLRPIIQSDVIGIVQSQSFATLWRTTNQTAHASLVSQLNNNSGVITLDLSPAVTGLITDLNNSKLSALAVHINVTPTTGKITIKNQKISLVHRYFNLYKASAYVLVVVALAVLGLAVFLSKSRFKLIRRILLWVGILALLEAAVLSVPSFINLHGTNVVTQDAVKTVAVALFHNLLVADIIIGSICLVAGISTTIYAHIKAKK